MHNSNTVDELEELIRELFYLKQEGEYWDFKEMWYDNNADLLHDIICMANNLHDTDSYLIIGVDDKSFAIKGVANDPNRKNTQNIVDFLKDKKFAGGIRPTAYVETLSNGLDVIIIKNSSNTPYYLTDDYRDVKANHIYTRIQDTNTSKNKSADIDKTALLWRKRFGINKTPLEQFAIYIENKDNWKECDEYNYKYFYKYNPVFIICEILPKEEIRDLILDELSDSARTENNWDKFNKESKREECYTAIQISCNLPSWRELHFVYNQTKIYSVISVAIDGGRCHMPAPFSYFAFLGDERIVDAIENYKYHYFINNTIEYKMIKFLSVESDSYKIALERAMECIIIFENEKERQKFDDYIINDVGLDKFKKVFKKQQSFAYSRKTKENQQGDQTDRWLQIDHKTAKTLKHFFKEFKQNKNIK